MHLRLGQKDKVWTGECIDKVEEDMLGRIEAIDEKEEENYLDRENKGEFHIKKWDNSEKEEDEEIEEEGDQADFEWDNPEYLSKSIHYPQSQQHQYYGPQQRAEDDDVTVEDTVCQPNADDMFRSHLTRNRALRRLRFWQHLRIHGGLGFRLTQHWKSWRQRAQWVCSKGHRYNRRWQRYSLFSKQRRTKIYQQSPCIDGEDHSNEKFTLSEIGKDITQQAFFK